MAKFKVGESVIYVKSNEKAVIQAIMPPARGRQMYKVYLNGSTESCLESNLIADTDLTDPFEKIGKGIFGSFLEYSKISTSFKIKNTSNTTVSSLKASNTIFKAYQFKPLLKFLNSDNRRLLIADEVGLGKTIEAGHIMLELKARNELKSALIVCPMSLQNKWQKELYEKFNFRFKIYEKKQDLISDIKLNDGRIRGIVNYEKIQLQKKDDKKESLFDVLDKKDVSFDFILCDEAHKLRNHTTKTHKGAKHLIEKSKSVVLLTATPIMISEENLFRLLQLLDENKYSDYSTFHNEMTINRPFIKALDKLNNNASLQTIAEELDNSEVHLFYYSGDDYKFEWKKRIGDLFRDIPLYDKIISDLKGKEDSPETRVDLQFNISEMNELNKLFSRTRKKEVTQDWSQAIREPKTKIIELYPEERIEFDRVVNEYIEENTFIDDYGEEKMKKGAALGLVQKKRQVASSVQAYLGQDLVKAENVLKRDAKFNQLLEIITHVVQKENKKLIVFAIFKKTLNYLHKRLKEEGINSAIIHGDIEDRNSELSRFKDKDEVKVLLSSEVGSEGLDLQFCDALVNYDLPWNPMIVEQRIGRIDRFGQKSKVVNIYNIIVKNSIQEDIYTRLLDRIGVFRGCIGDLEAILDKDLERQENVKVKNLREWFNSLEKELYTKEVSEEERLKKIEAIERAIITEQKNLEQISTGLTDSLTNDTYFKNELDNIQKNNKYVTEKELLNFVEVLIQDKLTTCNLEPIDESKMIYRLVIPLSSSNTLIQFLRAQEPENRDSELLFSRFITAIQGKTELYLTFSQETGYEDKSLIRINAYHPIVTAGMKYFEGKTGFTDNTFKFRIPQNKFESLIDKGEYLMAIYTTSYSKTLFGKKQETNFLVPIVFDLTKRIILEDRNISEEFIGKSQGDAELVTTARPLDEAILMDIRYDIEEAIDKIDSAYFEDQKMRNDTYKKMQVQRKSEYYDNRIDRLRNIVESTQFRISTSIDEKEKRNLESILPAQMKNLANAIDEKTDVLERINASAIECKAPKLLSLNHVTID